jgi:hypothetical protein
MDWLLVTEEKNGNPVKIAGAPTETRTVTAMQTRAVVRFAEGEIM